MAGRWVSPGTAFSSTNKTERHDIAEILLKVALNTITPNRNISKELNGKKAANNTIKSDLKIKKKVIFLGVGTF